MSKKYQIIPLDEQHFNVVRQFIHKQAKILERKDFFIVPPNALLDRCLSLQAGISYGAFAEGELAAIRLSAVPELREENLGYDLHYTTPELMSVAQFHGTLIDPQFRKYGIGSDLIMTNVNEIFSRGFKTVLVTCHPENIPSLTMLTSCGFVKGGVKRLANGWDRVILVLTRAGSQ